MVNSSSIYWGKFYKTRKLAETSVYYIGTSVVPFNLGLHIMALQLLEKMKLKVILCFTWESFIIFFTCLESLRRDECSDLYQVFKEAGKYAYVVVTLVRRNFDSINTLDRIPVLVFINVTAMDSRLRKAIKSQKLSQT